MRRLGVAAARVMLALAPLLLFMAGLRLSGFDGEVIWQMPAVDVTVVLIDRDGQGQQCGKPGTVGLDI